MPTLRDQAKQSGLGFGLARPEWNVNDWPPLLGGWRYNHASVVLDHPLQDDDAQTVVVLGGLRSCNHATNSVLLLNLEEENKQWQEGPPLNHKRGHHAAVVCNGGAYVIGGWTRFSELDTIERVDVENLCSAASASTTRNHWTILNCRLSTPRKNCSAATVYNRYILVMGGFDGEALSSVDVIDTAVQSNHTVIAGPSMTVPRSGCASAVVGHRIYVVGGFSGTDFLTSIESLHFKETSGDGTKETTYTVFSSSCVWTAFTDLALSVPRSCHAAVTVGSCVIVAGDRGSKDTVEVLDTEHGIVWNLPPLIRGRIVCSMLVFRNGIAVIGGYDVESCVTLPLTLEKVRFVMQLITVVWLMRKAWCHLKSNRFYLRCRIFIRVGRN